MSKPASMWGKNIHRWNKWTWGDHAAERRRLTNERRAEARAVGKASRQARALHRRRA